MRIVSIYGVLGEISPNNQFSVTYPYWEETFPLYSDFSKKYGLSPVCAIENLPSTEKGLEIILDVNEAGVLLSTFKKEQELLKTFWSMSKSSQKAFRMFFFFGALRYHFCSLIRAYTQEAKENIRLLEIPNYPFVLEKKDVFTQKKLCPKWISDVPVSKLNAYTTGGEYPESLFYEMTAFLTSARSLLDSLLPIIKVLGLHKLGSSPSQRSYHEFMNKIRLYKLPIHLETFLIENWTSWASKLADYRDCLLHYEVLSPTCLPYLMTIHSENRIIALQTWLPDNPEEKSVKNYKFDKHIEYLTYAHMTYLTMLDFLTQFTKLLLDNR
jgi:hypothetical protein